MKFEHVGFVCSGNICRSPMAEAIYLDSLKKRGIVGRASSRGTLGIEDRPAHANAVAALAGVGIDASAHRSRGLTGAWLDEVDAIVVMAEEHAAAAMESRAECEGKLVRLWRYAGSMRALGEIADPVGMDLGAFVRCRDLLSACLERWLAGREANAREPG